MTNVSRQKKTLYMQHYFYDFYAGSTTDLSGNTVTVVVTSSVSVFLVSLAIIFIIAFICGYCFGRKSNKLESSKTEAPVPLYEDVLSSAVQHHEEHDLELNDNVAYGQSKI